MKIRTAALAFTKKRPGVESGVEWGFPANKNPPKQEEEPRTPKKCTRKVAALIDGELFT